MKISEERDCCNDSKGDLVKLRMSPSKLSDEFKVCKHCFQLWERHWEVDSCDPDGGGYVWRKQEFVHSNKDLYNNKVAPLKKK